MKQVLEAGVQDFHLVRGLLLKNSEVEVVDGSQQKTLVFSTSRFGKVEIPEDKVLTFPFGLIGFEEARRFVMIDNPSGGPLVWLQAIDFPNLAFIIADPADFLENYQVPINDEELASIQLQDPKDGLVVAVLAIQKEPWRVTANLQGPIFINPMQKIGRQLVLSIPEYGPYHPVTLNLRPAKPAGKGRERLAEAVATEVE